MISSLIIKACTFHAYWASDISVAQMKTEMYTGPLGNQISFFPPPCNTASHLAWKACKLVNHYLSLHVHVALDLNTQTECTSLKDLKRGSTLIWNYRDEMVLEKTAKCHSWHSSWLQYFIAVSRSFSFVSQQIGQHWPYHGLWSYSLVKMGWIAEQCDFSKSWAYTCKYNTWN